ncbi:MAG: pyruvate carboxylase [Deltaproteobacteria bacterium]|nr:pyruvate carboxylase [Deltaproteobacteria bacterium]
MTAHAAHPPFKRLLVANRGEIAVRILRAATELNIRTVAIYSHEDRFSLYRFKADEAYKIGTPGKPIACYLDAANIVAKAKEWGVDAIHPGYGFLSENAEFARLCGEAGIKFIGPTPDVLAAFGDKVTARAIAKAAGVPVIPGSEKPLTSLADAHLEAKAIGYPVMLKAVSGGGGKGIRMLHAPAELDEAFQRAQSEAATNFGRADLYLEKMIVKPKHIEVQLLGDVHGQIVHLFERDCSVQRRNQKVVEVAPALGVSAATRERLCEYALRLARQVGYSCLGTVEFLLAADESAYFLEINPRIQVEHTVTEMITGVDLVQASILVAAGIPLQDPRIGIASQDSIVQRGAAIQCRLTTEDPTNNFAPDTGEIIAFRPGCGFGIRLDEGQATAGGVITPYYDSLLVKVISWAPNLSGAAAKMERSLSEFRIRGVKHNLALLKNVVSHPVFLASAATTSFFDDHPEVFKVTKARDRATKMLRYLADVTVNNPHELSSRMPQSAVEPLLPERGHVQGNGQEATPPTARDVYKQGGMTALRQWFSRQSSLQLTDTTMRDAHQSLFATRLRTRDMIRVAPFYRDFGHRFFSLEVWGGATFDTSLRFLREDPWQRLAAMRELVPHTFLQMLLRGDNAVGYTNYPEWVIRDFIRLTVDAGLDIFRIFDCFNQPDKMRIAVDEVKKRGAIAEVCLCYTGNVIAASNTKYTLAYYLNVAREIAAMGADILCIKDMAGLLRPQAARVLIKALRETVDLPIHLHTHDTAGVGVATLLEAANAGCEVVDGAVSSMAGLTSQPSLNGVVAAMAGDRRCPEVPLAVLDELARYWQVVRQMYSDFDPGLQSTSTDVYEHEIPGGQYSNLYEQARRVGVSPHDFHALTKRYREVNEAFGDLIKVTPSSKVVGDMALLLQKQGLTGPEWLAKRPHLDYPDSVLGLMRGDLGTPYGGIPAAVKSLVLGAGASATAAKASRPETPAEDSFASCESTLANRLGCPVGEREVLTYRLYPKVYLDYLRHREAFGDLSDLPTPVFFHGLRQAQEFEADLEPGKTLVISLAGVSDPDTNGKRSVFFNLNGFPRVIEVHDQADSSGGSGRLKADPLSPGHIAATMSGKVQSVSAKEGQLVKVGDPLLVVEAMKMEYLITAKADGTVAAVHVRPGDVITSGDLLVALA